MSSVSKQCSIVIDSVIEALENGEEPFALLMQYSHCQSFPKHNPLDVYGLLGNEHIEPIKYKTVGKRYDLTEGKTIGYDSNGRWMFDMFPAPDPAQQPNVTVEQLHLHKYLRLPYIHSIVMPSNVVLRFDTSAYIKQVKVTVVTGKTDETRDLQISVTPTSEVTPTYTLRWIPWLVGYRTNTQPTTNDTIRLASDITTVGSITFKIIKNSNVKAGDTLVLSGTALFGKYSEVRTVTRVTANTTITVNESLAHTYKAETTTITLRFWFNDNDYNGLFFKTATPKSSIVPVSVIDTNKNVQYYNMWKNPDNYFLATETFDSSIYNRTNFPIGYTYGLILFYIVINNNNSIVDRGQTRSVSVTVNNTGFVTTAAYDDRSVIVDGRWARRDTGAIHVKADERVKWYEVSSTGKARAHTAPVIGQIDLSGCLHFDTVVSENSSSFGYQKQRCHHTLAHGSGSQLFLKDIPDLKKNAVETYYATRSGYPGPEEIVPLDPSAIYQLGLPVQLTTIPYVEYFARYRNKTEPIMFLGVVAGHNYTFRGVLGTRNDNGNVHNGFEMALDIGGNYVYYNLVTSDIGDPLNLLETVDSRGSRRYSANLEPQLEFLNFRDSNVYEESGVNYIDTRVPTVRYMRMYYTSLDTINNSQYDVPVEGSTHDWTWERMLLCLGKKTMDVGGRRIQRYGQGTPACDDFMGDFCGNYRNSRNTAPDAVQAACACLWTTYDLQQTIDSSIPGLDVFCFNDVCGSGGSVDTTYRTGPMKKGCSASVCEQQLQILGPQILIDQSLQSLTCSHHQYTFDQDYGSLTSSIIPDRVPFDPSNAIAAATQASDGNTLVLGAPFWGAIVMLGLMVAFLGIFLWYRYRTPSSPSSSFSSSFSSSSATPNSSMFDEERSL